MKGFFIVLVLTFSLSMTALPPPQVAVYHQVDDVCSNVPQNASIDAVASQAFDFSFDEVQRIEIDVSTTLYSILNTSIDSYIVAIDIQTCCYLFQYNYNTSLISTPTNVLEKPGWA